MATYTKIPDGYARLTEIASLAEISTAYARKLLKQAGIPTKVISISGRSGQICICPQREALYAVLDK